MTNERYMDDQTNRSIVKSVNIIDNICKRINYVYKFEQDMEYFFKSL